MSSVAQKELVGASRFLGILCSWNCVSCSVQKFIFCTQALQVPEQNVTTMFRIDVAIAEMNRSSENNQEF